MYHFLAGYWENTCLLITYHPIIDFFWKQNKTKPTQPIMNKKQNWPALNTPILAFYCTHKSGNWSLLKKPTKDGSRHYGELVSSNFRRRGLYTFVTWLSTSQILKWKHKGLFLNEIKRYKYKTSHLIFGVWTEGVKFRYLNSGTYLRSSQYIVINAQGGHIIVLDTFTKSTQILNYLVFKSDHSNEQSRHKLWHLVMHFAKVSISFEVWMSVSR